MNSTEQALRTRIGIFLSAVNDINSLKFEEVYTIPPPNFPTARAMVIEIESEDSTREDGAGYENDAHANKRIFNVKIACVWGEVDPSDQAEGIEEKVYMVRRAIEQSSWLLKEDAAAIPAFEEIHVIGIDKRYNPAGYMEAGIISMQFIYFEAWLRDNTLAIISKPDIASAYTATAMTITINWSVINSGGITGYKLYISENTKPAEPTATVGSAIRTYKFEGLVEVTTYKIWVDSYNSMMERSSTLTANTAAAAAGTK